MKQRVVRESEPIKLNNRLKPLPKGTVLRVHIESEKPKTYYYRIKSDNIVFRDTAGRILAEIKAKYSNSGKTLKSACITHECGISAEEKGAVIYDI